jgi:hypothetical protein
MRCVFSDADWPVIICLFVCGDIFNAVSEQKCPHKSGMAIHTGFPRPACRDFHSRPESVFCTSHHHDCFLSRESSDIEYDWKTTTHCATEKQLAETEPNDIKQGDGMVLLPQHDKHRARRSAIAARGKKRTRRCKCATKQSPTIGAGQLMVSGAQAHQQ